MTNPFVSSFRKEACAAALADRLPPQPPRTRHRSLFLSDIHLGTSGCRADRLLEFLSRNEADVTYLIGDIFDTWRPMGANWSAAHDRVLQTILARARAGERIVYIPGNHDCFFRRYHGQYFGSIEIAPDGIHTAADGRRYLVTHGDACDVFAQRLSWLSRVGSWIESGIRRVNALVNRARRKAGHGDWLFPDNALAHINGLIRSHDRFEARLSALARDRGTDGIICGHFHQTALHQDFGVIYANCGDWIENCTAIVEAADGSLRIEHWSRDALVAAHQVQEAEANLSGAY